MDTRDFVGLERERYESLFVVLYCVWETTTEQGNSAERERRGDATFERERSNSPLCHCSSTRPLTRSLGSRQYYYSLVS